MSKYRNEVNKINNHIYSKLDAEKQYVGDKLDDVNIVFLKSTREGFICVKEDVTVKDKVKCCYCVIAVLQDARGTGLATSLMADAFSWFIHSEYNQLLYIADDDNIRSNHFATKVGFSYGWRHIDGVANVYIVINPRKLFNKILLRERSVMMIEQLDKQDRETLQNIVDEYLSKPSSFYDDYDCGNYDASDGPKGMWCAADDKIHAALEDNNELAHLADKYKMNFDAFINNIVETYFIDKVDELSTP